MRYEYGTVVAVLGLAGITAAPACKRIELNEQHCVRNDGDLTCAQYYPDGSRPFCAGRNDLETCPTSPGGDGCVADRPPDECYAPCGGGANDLDVGPVYFSDDHTDCDWFGTDSIAGTDTETGSETMGPGPGTQPSSTSPTEGTDTEPTDTETTGIIGCEGPDDCPPGRPFCEGEVCVACTITSDPDGACESLDPARPVCFDDTCVACTEDNQAACADTTPICDTDNNECVACNFHFECQDIGSPACHIAEGSCFDPAEQTTVDIDSGLQTLINGLEVGVPHAIILTGTSTVDTVIVNSNRVIALLSSQGTPPVFGPGAGAPSTINATGQDTVVYLQNVEVSGNATNSVPGVLATSGAAVYFDEARVIDNDGGGLLVEAGSEAYVRNSMLSGNGTVSPAVDVQSGTFSAVYSTFCRTLNLEEPVVQCTGGSTVDLRNSLIVSQASAAGSEVVCTGVTLSNNAVESTVTPEPWFQDFEAADYHLTAAGATEFADVAVWEVGDPPFDIEGDDRPNMDQAMDVAGADNDAN